jgi:hypothetical protein
LVLELRDPETVLTLAEDQIDTASPSFIGSKYNIYPRASLTGADRGFAIFNAASLRALLRNKSPEDGVLSTNLLLFTP